MFNTSHLPHNTSHDMFKHWKSPEYRSAFVSLLRAMSRGILGCMGLGLAVSIYGCMQFSEVIASTNAHPMKIVALFAIGFVITTSALFFLMLYNRYRVHQLYGHLPMNQSRPINVAMQTLLNGPQALADANETFQVNQAKREAQAGQISVSVESDGRSRGGLAMTNASVSGDLSMHQNEGVTFGFDQEHADSQSDSDSQDSAQEIAASSVLQDQQQGSKS